MNEKKKDFLLMKFEIENSVNEIECGVCVGVTGCRGYFISLLEIEVFF